MKRVLVGLILLAFPVMVFASSSTGSPETLNAANETINEPYLFDISDCLIYVGDTTLY